MSEAILNLEDVNRFRDSRGCCKEAIKDSNGWPIGVLREVPLYTFYCCKVSFARDQSLNFGAIESTQKIVNILTLTANVIA